MTYVDNLQLGLFPVNKTVHAKLSKKRQFHEFMFACEHLSIHLSLLWCVVCIPCHASFLYFYFQQLCCYENLILNEIKLKTQFCKSNWELMMEQKIAVGQRIPMLYESQLKPKTFIFKVETVSLCLYLLLLYPMIKVDFIIFSNSYWSFRMTISSGNCYWLKDLQKMTIFLR